MSGPVHDLLARVASGHLARDGAQGWLFAAQRPEPVRGLYIHGKVGRGKTMLIDQSLERANPSTHPRFGVFAKRHLSWCTALNLTPDT